MKLSLIIVNFNTCDLLRDCLASIRLTRDCELEVIVVDNHSSDQSVSMVRTEFPETRVLVNSGNLGFSKANNRGIKESTGKYILLLNSDTIVRPGALKAMSDLLDGCRQTGAVGCRLLNEDGSVQASVSSRPGPMMLFFRLSGLASLCRADYARRFLGKYFGFLLGTTVRSYLAPYAAQHDPIEVENISGACLMLRREVVDQIGGFDEAFFMYLEDMDYCLRLRKSGWKLYYTPKGEVVHLVGKSSGGRMRNYSVNSYRSLFYFYQKHSSRRTVLFVRLLVLVASGARWLSNNLRAAISTKTVYRQNSADLAYIIRLCLE